MFYRALKGEFDLVVAQYHDQGHIPTKLIAFDETVNVSLGAADSPRLGGSRDGARHRLEGQGDHIDMRAALAYARMMASRAAAARAAA